jgi:iron complex outermembrane receptor protein
MKFKGKTLYQLHLVKKSLSLSLVCVSALVAETALGTVEVEADLQSEVINEVSGEGIKSADVAEALYRQTPSVSLKRRSGISNDITIRGQVKDNIAVTIDGAKVHGACPNRMDPPISHILANNIDYIEINQGPFTVEEFGALTADVRIHTIKPEKDIHGQINLNAGSWDYLKGSMNLSGGSDTVRFLLSASSEKGGQYEDGDGNDFAGQIARNVAEGKAPAAAQYRPEYRDMDAFEKQTLMAKLYWDIADNQTLKLSYTGNRSDTVLYPSTKMDAIYDDSDIFSIGYTAKNLGAYSRLLDLSLYQSKVEHPMSTMYRMMSVAMGETTSKLNTEVQGARLKNRFDLGRHEITVGLDYSLRSWDGKYYKNGNPFPAMRLHSIWDADTENMALFASQKVHYGNWLFDMGLRYDNTEITSADPMSLDNDYNQLNGYLSATYEVRKGLRYFVGVGKSSRVPDAKELFWRGSMGNQVGTPDLKETVNYELDLGMEMDYGQGNFKLKAFYSMLDDFIAYNNSQKRPVTMMGETSMLAWNAYENVDATLYGIELGGTYRATEGLYFDYGMAYQRGKKDTPLIGQTGTNLPEIPPFKYNLALNYDYDETLGFKAEVIGAGEWSRFDAENGEQPLDAYVTLNLKASKRLFERFEVTVGVDNLLDETYAVSNTYKDLVLLALPGSEIMLMNEPGRYIYTNIQYSF